MTDEFSRLIDGDDDVSKRLLSSSDVDAPSDSARRAARVAIGLGAAAPVSAAAAGTGTAACWPTSGAKTAPGFKEPCWRAAWPGSIASPTTAPGWPIC